METLLIFDCYNFHFTHIALLQYSSTPKPLNIFTGKAIELWTWPTAPGSHGPINFSSHLNFDLLDKRYANAKGSGLIYRLAVCGDGSVILK